MMKQVNVLRCHLSCGYERFSRKQVRIILFFSKTFDFLRMSAYLCRPLINAALVKGLRRLPFTEESRVRIPYVVRKKAFLMEGFFSFCTFLPGLCNLVSPTQLRTISACLSGISTSSKPLLCKRALKAC